MGTTETVDTIIENEDRRHLALDGTYNVRDIGGYATTDGRTTRWRTLIRADSPHRLAPGAQQELLDLGLRTIIDLRRPAEIAQYPNLLAAAPGLRYLQISLDRVAPDEQATFPTLPEIYRAILDTAATQLGTIIATLAAPDALPGLVHCQVGKDRTGIVIALALGAVGVPAETIIADYALSEAQLAGEFLSRFEQSILASGADWEPYRHLLTSPAPFMRDVLTYLDEQHSGIIGYLRAAGVRDEQIAALRDALTE